MSFPLHTNLAYATVATAPSPATSGTSLTLASGLGSLFPASNFYITVYPPFNPLVQVNPLHSNAEICLCTSRTGDVLTITRAQGTTTAKSIKTGWQVANTATSEYFTDLENAITAGGGSAVWGAITGTLSAQSDLQAALNAKQNLDATLTELSGLSLVQGDILYQNATVLTRLPAGTSGQVLKTLGAGANPNWANETAGSVAWGAITGTLSAQTDLQTALNNKQPLDTTLTELAGLSLVQGDILYQNATNLVRLPAGTSGQILGTQGAGANPQWVNSSVLTQGVLTYSGTTNIDLTGNDFQTLALTGDVTFTTSNRAAARSKTVIITCDGTPHNFTFPSWVWIGAGAPTSIAASKKAVISLTCLGSADTDIIAVYSPQNP